MNKTHISALISALLIGGVPAYANSHDAVPAVVQSQSVSSTVTIESPGPWYNSAKIRISNVSDQELDLEQMEVHVSVPSYANVQNPWGDWRWAFSLEEVSPSEGRKNYIIRQTNPSVKLAAGGVADISFGVGSDGTAIASDDVKVDEIIIKNDPALSGKIKVSAPSAPHSSLNKAQFLIEGGQYKETREVAWGQELTVDNLKDGTYKVTPLEVRSGQGYAKGGASGEVVVESGQTAPLVSLDYQAFIYFAAIDLRLPSIPGMTEPVYSEVSVSPAGSADVLRQLKAAFGQKIEINELDDGQRYDLRYSDAVINNQRHQLAPGLDILVSHQQAQDVSPALTSEAVDDSQFTQVKPQITGLPDSVSSVKLKLEGDGASYVFTLATDAAELPYRIEPGQYQLTADSVAISGENYVLDLDGPVTIGASSPQVLALPFKNGVKLAVKGFPDFVANGTVTNDSEGVTNEIGQTRVDAIFKYAGISGSGDPGVILEKDKLPLHRTMSNAKIASEASGKHVQPVMVVYTANASGGATFDDLTNNDLLYKHYATFITQAWAAQEYAKGGGHSPMSFVMNPDFLGELQKNQNHVDDLNRAGSVKVNEQLANALSYMKTTYGFEPSGTVPTFDDTLNGYIQSLNYIMKAYAPDVSFGWQINLWAVGSANWVHTTEDQSHEMGSLVGQFVNSLGVYDSQYKPDYIVFDKYERDGFGSEAIKNYAYNATSWQRYLDYVKVISDAVDSPAMIWQIPGGHMPTQQEGNSMIESNHEASGGSFFMGDSRIGTDVDSIHSGLLDKNLGSSAYNGSVTVRDLLVKDNGYDWSYRRMQDLPAHNVFALLWGGGSTTAVVSIGSNGSDSGWLNNKVTDYVNNPTCLYGSDCDGSIWGGNGNDPDPDPNKPPVITLDPLFNADSGAQVTITASAVDPEGENVSYRWEVPSAVNVVSGSDSDTLVVTAPVVPVDTSYTLSLTASDGSKSSVAKTTLKVKGKSGGEGQCVNIAHYVDGQQYQPGQEVQYQGNHYKAERWTDVGKAPDEPYAGWILLGSCQ